MPELRMRPPVEGEARGMWQCVQVTERDTKARWARNKACVQIEEYFPKSQPRRYLVVSELGGLPDPGELNSWGEAVKKAIELNNASLNEAKRILKIYDYID